MIVNVASDEAIDRLNDQVRSLGEALFAKLPAVATGALIPKSDSGEKGVFSFGSEEWCYVLRDGNVAATLNDATLYFYEPGEVIGFEAMFGGGVLEMKHEFAVTVDVYDREKLLKKLRKDEALFLQLLEYLAACQTLYQLLLGCTLAATRRPNFQIRRLAAGTLIIREGDTDTDVYSLIRGEAEVSVKGMVVGKIQEGEVFGEMSRLTGAPRSASVGAKTDCEVMVFGGDDFAVLAETNPAALHDIARNLSERLDKLNQAASRQAPR